MSINTDPNLYKNISYNSNTTDIPVYTITDGTNSGGLWWGNTTTGDPQPYTQEYPGEWVSTPWQESPNLYDQYKDSAPQHISAALMGRVQAILEDYQHTELTNHRLTFLEARIQSLLNTWKDAGILETWSIDFKEVDPSNQSFTIFISYTTSLSPLSQHIAIPLLSNPFTEPEKEPDMVDTPEKMRLKDLIL